MNRRQKIIVSVVGIFIVLLALVGLTYGYFLTRIQGNTNTTSITVTTADLKLVYLDGSPNIEALKIRPGDTVGTKTFTVANEGNATVNDYKVYLENVQNSFEIKEDVTYTLTCKSYTKYGETDQTESGTCTGVSTPTTFPSVMSVIATNTIEQGITHEYEITVTYENKNYDQSIDMNKNLFAKINIYDGKTKFLATEIMKNVTAGTNGTTLVEPDMLGVTANTSVPAQTMSGANEKIVSYTLEDYEVTGANNEKIMRTGTSYYYRGAVQDNYVNYAGKCWRIVRIEGDGAIKITLASATGTCDTEGALTDNSASFGQAKYADVYQSLIDYENTQNSTSVLKYKMDEFLETIPSEAQANLVYREVCIVNYNMRYTNTGAEWDYVSNMYYSQDIRLFGKGQTPNASLLCGKGAVRTNPNTKVYPLTADEYAFAGATANNTDSNINYYLYNNAITNNSYWTLTVAYKSGSSASFFSFLVNKNLGSTLSTEYPYGEVRPTVSLKPDVVISKGNGLVGSPYEVI